MLKLIRIENIILVHAAQIPFEKGLNILSGETGAGKSAVMQALRLIAGEKGDPKLIRHGTKKAVVEALFEPSTSSPIWQILEESGFSFDKEEPLVIRRELLEAGKSRSFINDQIASLSLLKILGELLFDIASQHASQKLHSDSFQRSIVDSWGCLEDELDTYAKSWEEEIASQEELDLLIANEAHRLREIETKTREIKEIEEAKLDPIDDEMLFQSYSELVTGEERFNLVTHLLELFHNLPLSKIKSSLAELTQLDPTTKSLLERMEQSKIELDEAAWELGQYQTKIPFNPAKMQELDDRLKLVTKLKRKYGTTIDEILEWLKEQKNTLNHLMHSDDKKEQLEEKLAQLKPKNDLLAQKLTKQRISFAKELSLKMTQELHELNMPKAEFFIEVTSTTRSKMGEDKVSFLFQPNAGGKKISVKEAASGGELARILLSIKMLLRDKESSASLIFDEVDANIGGETARILGGKLALLGKTTQVIAITHFPQVASQADHHLRVKKSEENGETKSFIELLTDTTRPVELARMIGK